MMRRKSDSTVHQDDPTRECPTRARKIPSVLTSISASVTRSKSGETVCENNFVKENQRRECRTLVSSYSDDCRLLRSKSDGLVYENALTKDNKTQARKTTGVFLTLPLPMFQLVDQAVNHHHARTTSTKNIKRQHADHLMHLLHPALGCIEVQKMCLCAKLVPHNGSRRKNA